QDDIRTHAENPDKLKRINKAAVYMDPMAFERFNIEQVPTMVYERKLSDNTKLVGKVKGLISASYLQNETESAAANPDYDGSEVFLGEMGSIFPIA
ncbi:TrbC family F-type conjugative pilus assembly protein, partial [Vibrio breoganii]